jgi:3-oxoacyl-[acyl-carrier-protein] synthase II
MRQVVVTGIGVLTCVGIGKDAFWEAIKSGKSGIKKLSTLNTDSLPVQIGGEIPDFDPAQYIPKKALRHMDRFTHFGVSAAKLAIQDAGLVIDDRNADRIGVVIGTSIAGLGGAEQEYNVFKTEGWRKINPFSVASIIASNCPSQISIALRVNGPSLILSTACASATDAIGYARDCIRRGEVDVMLAGGCETPLNPFALGVFSSTGVLSKRNDDPVRACRPFDKKRDGQVLGEGAGILVLEDLAHALRRGAHIYAEVAGYGRTSDCIHPVIQEATGRQAARAMRLALLDAGVRPEEVDYINAHGSSTVPNDRIETNVIKEVFGEHAYKLAISSTKSMIGHLQGGCGGPESVATVLAVKHDLIPPTINYEYRDPECDLDYVPNTARQKPVNVALKNSFGFGGKNAVLIFKKYPNNHGGKP